MRKLLYITLLGVLIIGISACEDTPENPGDFSLKSELKLGDVLESRTTGAKYPLVVAREFDSTYRYFYEVYDTLKDAAGEPILDSNGKLQITVTEESYLSRRTAHFIEFEKIMFPSYEDVDFDTITLTINSNANWQAPMNVSVNWYNNVDGTSTGGGDGTFKFSVKQFGNVVSKNVAVQEIFTRDSTVMYRFYFGHTGLKYTGE